MIDSEAASRVANSKIFEGVVRPLLAQGLSVRFHARGASMSPAIRDGEVVEVTPVIVTELRKDDIVLAKSNFGFQLHRIVMADPVNDVFITRGDCGQEDDPALKAEQILGLARAKEVRLGRNLVQARFRGVRGWMLRSAARAQYVSTKLLRKAASLGVCGLQSIFVFLVFFFFAAALLHAQVAVDATTSANNEFTGAGTFNLNFTHTTTATANRLLVVGVSMNITNSPGSAVASVTYGGTALTLIGAHNDAGSTRRVEMWSLLNPASGTNVAITVSVNIPTAGVKVGVVAGATTLTDVDQTMPLGSFVSADGAAAGYGQLNPMSVVNGMVLDTVAVGGNVTSTPYNPQVQQWNATTVSGTDPPAVTGVGSSRTGAPSVPLAQTFSGNSNWSYGAIPINPSTADIAVTTSVSAVALGQNSTYNITITNNGPSAANNVTLADTYNATNLTLVSYTPSAGTTCTNTATTVNCTLPTPFASGAVATVAVVVSTTAAGFYPNTATITDSGTPPDPNTGNNSYVALAPVVSVVCGTNTITAGGTLTGTINTYFPGSASVAAGATSIPVGTSRGAGGTIAAGSLLLVIQMQDASINTSDTVAYGNGSTGQGFTTINNAGNYEWVRATGTVAGGDVPIAGAGAGGGLVFGYTNAAASATKGISTYQVVLVPQYTSATLGAITASSWNGTTGGIIALDIAGQLNLGGATVAVDGMGFRGGAGMQLTGNAAGSSTDYRFPGPANYTGAAEAGADGAKGEGVAGTSKFVEYNNTYLRTINGVGYPSGTAGTDGSMARGAPGNAGAGGTDSDPTNNDQNDGGGGGGNGGSGGFGGDSWNTNLSSGGEGGAPFPATIDRIAMGGGGGAGTRNNSNGDNLASSGSTGGGIIFIRADSLTGTATLTANGVNSYNGTANDAGGGGGAGGTIVVLAANGGESGLTLQANGGNGGNAWETDPYSLADRHGPGGGGGGGVIFVSGAPASVSVAGGASGLTLTPGVPYGSTPGNAGTSVTNATLGQVTGIQSVSLCTPDLTLTKSHVGNFTRGSAASYTITVSNVSPYGATTGLVTMNDTLPLGISPTSATGTGWTCSISGQTVSCTRSDALAAGASYPAITLNALVAQSAPATLINVATIGGGGEADLSNDTATDTATVVSSADMSVTDAESPNPVASGANITYTVVATDNGPSAADNATLVVPVPANTTFVSFATPSGWSCLTPLPGNGGNVVCTDADMAGLTSATFSMVVKVNTGVANGTVITGTANVSSSVIDPNSGNNTATVTTLVGTNGPNLSVTNADTPNPVQAGNNITYTQVVTNTGSTAITNGTFTEATPANTTFVSITPPAGWTCTGFPATPCSATTVAAGASGTFTVVYQVAAGTASGTVITDTATVNASNQTFGANAATATDVVGSATQADVALSTAFSPSGGVYAGNAITYTQTITNKGPAAATGVSFTEATPTNTTFESVLAPAGWTCTAPAVGATGNVVCNDTASLASGNSADIVIVVNVPASTAGGAVTANSSVTATTSDPNLSNNSTTEVTGVGDRCDLAVTNAGTPSPVTAGNDITYTQVVTNGGPSNCTTATLSEPTPANTTFVSVAVVTTGGGTWTCPNTAPVACTNPSVPPGSTGTMTVVYQVAAGTAAGTIIADTVTVASATNETNTSNNTATVNIAVTSATQADLSVTNSGPTSVTAGNNVTYTQTVTNAGPAAATTPKLVETLPTGTTAVSLTGPTGWTCVLATLTCTDGTNLAANTTTTAFTFVVTVPSTIAQGTNLSQTDTVSSTTGDSNAGNNSVTVSTYVLDSADLSVTNTATPIPVQAGNNITYTQVVTNAGPSTATTVSLTETLPANTTAVTLTGPTGWTCTVATLTCTDPSLAPATPATITYTVKVTAGTAAGTTINESASVTSSITDPNTSNNTATASDVVALATQADLVSTNTATPTSVAAGSNVTYTQTEENLGTAVATGTTFTEVTPPNTTFQSITPQAGWTCTTPAVGGTGTITCTDGTNLAVNATASFTVVLQVISTTASGTNITDTVTANATNIVPNLTSNSASATVVVANANSADMAIVKTATPNPVTEGTPLLYSLAITNNGPATATDVTITDTLPSTVTYLSSTATQGSCSEAGGTVTCLLGTMLDAGTATVSILTIPGQAGVISNTANVTADQTDSNLTNNTSTVSVTVLQPTKITLLSFSAHYATDKNGSRRAVLTWKTGGEAHNLGFNIYRDLNGTKVRMNPSVIAGSALLMKGALPKHSGKSYAWMDPSAPVSGASYWLEDIDINGTRTMHGPVLVSISTSSDMTVPEARMLNQMNQAQPPAPGSQESHIVEGFAQVSKPATAQLQKQFELAAHPAVKIFVQHEGWHIVSQPQLVQAGLDPNVDPALLHLYAEAVEQPIQITGATAGPGGFGPGAAISFYGTGINTVFSGTRVYWLAAGSDPGLRIQQLPASSGSNQPPASYSATVELQQHTIYFAALLTTNGQNFFGSLVSSTPVDQSIEVPHLDTNSTQQAQLEVALQGIVTGFPHDVLVTLNGTNLGDITFTGQDQGTMKMTIPPGVLLPWSNTVTLTALNGDYDTSLVNYIRITYPHKYAADSDRLKFTGRTGDEIRVTNFDSAPTVLDITNPGIPVLLTPNIIANNGKYEIALQVPFTTTKPGTPVRHTLFAVANYTSLPTAEIVPNHPSHWHAALPGADIAMVTHGDFAAALRPLVRAHGAEGKTSAIVPVGELYDEFNFGERSPFAIKRFLWAATHNWKKTPMFLLLNGRASLDPRNYLGFGDLDYVPTRMIASSSMMTASDDWFSDFTNTGFATIATGRLPVSTPTEANTVIDKIATYEGKTTNGPWTSNALFVADKDDSSDDFTQDSQTVQALLPSTTLVTDVFVDNVGVVGARTNIVSSINSGQLLVNYLGHGSEEQWSGSDIFDETTVSTLTNSSQLPIFLIMDCLNGYFQDVYAEPLGVSLILAQDGGGVAVMASSGLNQGPPQTQLDSLVVQNAFSVNGQTLGQAILNAKGSINDPDVRQTFVLFGDPAMRPKQPADAQ